MPLEIGLEDATELLQPSPDVATALEAGGVVALLGGPVLFELVSPGELDACDDAVSAVELGRIVPGGGESVVVGCALG